MRQRDDVRAAQSELLSCFEGSAGPPGVLSLDTRTACESRERGVCAACFLLQSTLCTFVSPLVNDVSLMDVCAECVVASWLDSDR